MARYRAADRTPVDADELRRAMDGRRQDWLAQRAGVSKTWVGALLKGGRTTRRSVYARLMEALPALPPPPANGHGDGQAHE